MTGNQGKRAGNQGTWLAIMVKERQPSYGAGNQGIGLVTKDWLQDWQTTVGIGLVTKVHDGSVCERERIHNYSIVKVFMTGSQVVRLAS